MLQLVTYWCACLCSVEEPEDGLAVPIGPLKTLVGLTLAHSDQYQKFLGCASVRSTISWDMALSHFQVSPHDKPNLSLDYDYLLQLESRAVQRTCLEVLCEDPIFQQMLSFSDDADNPGYTAPLAIEWRPDENREVMLFILPLQVSVGGWL